MTDVASLEPLSAIDLLPQDFRFGQGKPHL